MKLVPEVVALVPDMTSWRHGIHARPETAFEEAATSAFVADKLRSFGLEVHTGTREDGSGRRAPRWHRERGDRPARRSRRAAHPRAIGRRARIDGPGQDARLRPRRPHGDAARRGGGARAQAGLRRHGSLHLPARRGERGRRPRDGRGGPVRPLSDARGLRHAQLAVAAAGNVRGARGRVHGRLRHLRDRRDRQGRARRDGVRGQGPDAVRRARDQRAADHRRAQSASARRRGSSASRRSTAATPGT